MQGQTHIKFTIYLFYTDYIHFLCYYYCYYFSI